MVLSKAEFQSLILGATVGFVTALSGGKDAAWMFIILTGVALGGKKVDVGVLENVQKEPLYALTTSVLAFIITAFLIVPRLPGGL
jgi:hypothetical protein